MRAIEEKLNSNINKTNKVNAQDNSNNNIIQISNDKIKINQKSNIIKKSKDKSKQKSYKIIIIIILISFIILCSACLLILKLILKKKKEKKEELNNIREEDISILTESKNKIIALYQVEEGKTFLFFNKNESNLKANDFFIIEKSFLNINLRNLNSLEINDNFFKPKESENLTVEISFKKNLTSLKDFFKNNKNLIKADLKNFSMAGVVSMESTFSGCSNLYEVDLEDAISQNLININNLFEKCKKLIKVNLSLKNISELLESNNCFIDCKNLKFINLSSFHKINNFVFRYKIKSYNSSK